MRQSAGCIWRPPTATFAELNGRNALSSGRHPRKHYNVRCTYTGEYGIWQYSPKGSVPGINGQVDMNYGYKEFGSTEKTVDELAREVIAGKWENGQERKNRLTAAGYNYRVVQNRVNEILW